MKAKVILEVTLEELIEIQQAYLEIGEEPPGIEEIKNNFIDNFFADRSDYLDADRIKVYFV